MWHRLVINTGTSGFGRFHVFGRAVDESGLLTPVCGQVQLHRDKGGDEVLEAAVETRWGELEAMRVSAETSLLRTLGGTLLLGADVVLLHTDTLGSMLAAHVLELALPERFDVRVKLRALVEASGKPASARLEVGCRRRHARGTPAVVG